MKNLVERVLDVQNRLDSAAVESQSVPRISSNVFSLDRVPAATGANQPRLVQKYAKIRKNTHHVDPNVKQPQPIRAYQGPWSIRTNTHRDTHNGRMDDSC